MHNNNDRTVKKYPNLIFSLAKLGAVIQVHLTTAEKSLRSNFSCLIRTNWQQVFKS